jgi:hypothetical protein
MNPMKATVRLDAEQRTAELELMTPNGTPNFEGFEFALKRIGIRPLRKIEMATPRYQITRTKLVEMNGYEFTPSRLMQVLSIVQDRKVGSNPYPCGQAA